MYNRCPPHDKNFSSKTLDISVTCTYNVLVKTKQAGGDLIVPAKQGQYRESINVFVGEAFRYAQTRGRGKGNKCKCPYPDDYLGTFGEQKIRQPGAVASKPDCLMSPEVSHWIPDYTTLETSAQDEKGGFSMDKAKLKQDLDRTIELVESIHDDMVEQFTRDGVPSEIMIQALNLTSQLATLKWYLEQIGEEAGK